MAKISFRGEYVEPVLTGKKTSTWRRGDRSNSFTAGQNIVLINSDNDEPFAQAKIEKITIKNLQKMTLNDAISDGFPDIVSLIKILQKTYPELTENEPMTVISFAVISE